MAISRRAISEMSLVAVPRMDRVSGVLNSKTWAKSSLVKCSPASMPHRVNSIKATLLSSRFLNHARVLSSSNSSSRLPAWTEHRSA